MRNPRVDAYYRGVWRDACHLLPPFLVINTTEERADERLQGETELIRTHNGTAQQHSGHDRGQRTQGDLSNGLLKCNTVKMILSVTTSHGRITMNSRGSEIPYSPPTLIFHPQTGCFSYSLRVTISCPSGYLSSLAHSHLCSE